jgi:hypothetical protein
MHDRANGLLRIFLPRTPVNNGYPTTVMAEFAEHSCFSVRSTGNIKYIVPLGKEEDTKDVLVQPHKPCFWESRSTLH